MGDMAGMTTLHSSPEYAQAMAGKVDGHLSGKVSQDQWVRWVKDLFEKNQNSCVAVLTLYEKQIGENAIAHTETTDEAGIEAHALRVFRSADKNLDGRLDLQELANLRNSPAFR